MDPFSDPVVDGTVIQTVVLTFTLAIFILSFRSQERAIHEAAYQRVLDDSTDAMKMPLTNPALAKMQAEVLQSSTSGTAPLSADEMAIRNYLLLMYGIFERAYLLYTRKWIDKDSWSQFDLWLQRMMTYPNFVEVHRFSTGMYDKPFQDYVDGLLDKDHRRSQSAKDQ